MLTHFTRKHRSKIHFIDFIKLMSRHNMTLKSKNFVLKVMKRIPKKMLKICDLNLFLKKVSKESITLASRKIHKIKRSSRIWRLKHLQRGNCCASKLFTRNLIWIKFFQEFYFTRYLNFGFAWSCTRVENK